MERRWWQRSGFRWLLIATLLVAPQILRAQGEPAPAAETIGQPGEQEGSLRSEASGADTAEPAAAEGEAEHGAAAGQEGDAAGHGEGEGEGGGHADPVTPVLFGLVIILIGAKLGGAVFLKISQPAVLGELVCGVVLGNLLLLAHHTAETAAGTGGVIGWYGTFVQSTLHHGSPIDVLARIGVVILLFMVGLESNLKDMMKVGLTSFWVAVIGVVCPFILGFFVSLRLLPGGPHDILVHVFIGACLTATSVGITARVLQELGRLDQDESRIILGAAVIDDVMGLVILAVVSGMVNAKATGTALAPISVMKILALAVGFLFVAVLVGQWLSPRVFSLASKLRGEGVLLITALVICFILAGLANVIGLAPIVGAFAAGLLLDEVHYVDFKMRGHDHHLEELIEPIAALMVPIFFVQMGMTVKLTTFTDVRVLGFAALLTVAAIIGKQSCGLVVPKMMDRISVGVGMIPRGEVGLIFAAIGASLKIGGERVINDVSNSAVVIMVIVTTMVTPPVLQWTLKRGDAKRRAQGAEQGASF